MTAFTLKRKKKKGHLSKQVTQISLIPMDTEAMDEKKKKRSKRISNSDLGCCHFRDAT